MGSRTVWVGWAEACWWGKAAVEDVSVTMLDKFLQSKPYEILEVPQIQLIDGVVDVPVVLQRQVPTGPLSRSRCSSWTRLLTSPLLRNDRCAVAVRRQGRGAEADPHGSVCSEDHRDSQLQSIDKVVNVPGVQVVQVPPVPIVEKTGGSHSCRPLRKSLRSQPVLGQGR